MFGLKNVKGAKNIPSDKGKPQVLVKSNLFTTGTNGEVVLSHDDTIRWVEKILITMPWVDSQKYLNLLYEEYGENPHLYESMSKMVLDHCEKVLPLKVYYRYCNKNRIPIQQQNKVFSLIQLYYSNMDPLPYIHVINHGVKTELMYSKLSEWYHCFISIVPIAQLGDVRSLSNGHLTYLVKIAYEAWWEYITSDPDTDTDPKAYISPEELDFKELETALNEQRKW